MDYFLTYSIDNLIKKLSLNYQDLDEVNLSLFNISDKKLNQLCYAIMKNTLIKSLNLSCMNLTDYHCKYINHILFHNKSLTHINLSNNLISNEGLKYLEYGLSNNNHLTHLNLFGNNINDDGAFTLARILGNNKSKITSIDIRCNNITEKGFQSLLHVLYANTELCYLYYDSYLIRKILNDVINERLKFNTSNKETKIE